jgi:hypothetical protein
MPPDRTRPLGVTLIALRFLFITLSGVIATCGLNSRFSGYDIPFPLLACLALPPIIAIASLVAAGGLMDMRAWARNLAIGIMVVDMLSPLGFAPAGGVTSPEQSAGILGAWIVDIIVLVYLLRPSISERFE